MKIWPMFVVEILRELQVSFPAKCDGPPGWLVLLKPYLHGDILPGKLLKIEQASEKSSCKSGIFFCAIS